MSRSMCTGGQTYPSWFLVVYSAVVAASKNRTAEEGVVALIATAKLHLAAIPIMTVEYPAQTKASEEDEIHYSPTAPLVVAGTAVPVAVESPIIVSLPPAGQGHAPTIPVVVMGTTVPPPTATPVQMLTPPPAPQVYTGTLPPVAFKISRDPSQVTCPYCQKTVVTQTKEELAGTTWIMVCVCLILCWPCAWVPCVMKQCQDTQHFCPNCRRQIALREALS